MTGRPSSCCSSSATTWALRCSPPPSTSTPTRRPRWQSSTRLPPLPGNPVTPEPTTPAPLAAYLPDAATGTAPGHGLLAGRRLLVVAGGQQTYGQTDPPTGIGRAISLLAAREGAAVAVADIDQDAAQATVDRITAEGGTGHAVAGDASDPGDAGRILTDAANVLGGLDAMTLNTGIAAGLGLTPTTCADWDRVMAVNVRAHFLALQAAVTVLEPGGAITLTSSTAARVVTTTDIPPTPPAKPRLRVSAPTPLGVRPTPNPGQRRHGRAHRHQPRPARHPVPSRARRHPHPARTARHRMGDRRRDCLPALRHRLLHHRHHHPRRRRLVLHSLTPNITAAGPPGMPVVGPCNRGHGVRTGTRSF